MKSNFFNNSPNPSDEEIGRYILKEHNTFKHGEVEKQAKVLASRNLPKHTGDDIFAYISFIWHKYAELILYKNQHLLPGSKLTETIIDGEWANNHHAYLNDEIADRDHKNIIDKSDLGDYHPKSFVFRILAAVICAIIYGTGEIIFNTKGLELFGENKLLASILALALSVATMLLAHLAPLYYKKAMTVLRRRLIVLGTVSLATAFFIVLAVLRSKVVALQGINISRLDFIIINEFFFIVSCLLAHAVDPTWEEFRVHFKHLERLSNIEKRDEEIEEIKDEKITLTKKTKEKQIQNFQTVVRNKYWDDLIVQLYYDSVAHFKNVNFLHRTDGIMPDCFRQPIPNPMNSNNSGDSNNNFNSQLP